MIMKMMRSHSLTLFDMARLSMFQLCSRQTGNYFTIVAGRGKILHKHLYSQPTQHCIYVLIN